MDWARSLELPSSTIAGDKTIPKTVLTKQGNLTKTEQRHLKQLKRLGHSTPPWPRLTHASRQFRTTNTTSLA